jgi:hypothetical protein
MAPSRGRPTAVVKIALVFLPPEQPHHACHAVQPFQTLPCFGPKDGVRPASAFESRKHFMRRSQDWRELVLIIVLGPLIGLGIGLLAEMAAPTLVETWAPPALLNRN